MSSPLLGMMINVAFSYPPQGYAACNGQLLSISQYTALYSLLGVTYGGDGNSTFGVPQLQGRRALHRGQSSGTSTYTQGQQAGAESVTILQSNLAAHSHTPTFTNTSTLTAQNGKASTNIPDNGLQLARGRDGDSTPSAIPFIYAPAATTNQIALGGINLAGTNTVTTSVAGASVPMNVQQPLNVLLTCIALEGIFPTRN